MRIKDKYLELVLLHIIIGLILFFVPSLSRLFFIVVVVYFFARILKAPNHLKTTEVLIASAYLVGSEILFRMTGANFFYESSKYLVILFMFTGIFFRGMSSKAYPYFFYLLALFPAIVVASITLSYDANFRTNVAFVLSGPICLAVAALFCYDKVITKRQLLNIIMSLALPSISLMTYLFAYSPTIKDTLSGTGSNFAASGGFGPNQVSTALGLGMFAMVVRLFIKSPTLVLKIINIVILCAMTFRAIVTFSRGGVVAAIIAIFGFLLILFYRSSLKQRNQILWSFLFFSIAIVITWSISSYQTLGLIDKRYANQDAIGREKEDISTGRSGLFSQELGRFYENPFFGVGASRMKDIRVEATGLEITSHNEISRLLSEHGFFGVFGLIILITVPLIYRFGNKRNYCFYAFFFFWFATINHSAMRIAAPALLYAFTLLNVTNEINPLHRKQIK